MNMAIQYKKWFHYFLIYFMIISCQSNLYSIFIEKYKGLFVMCFALIMILNKKYRDLYSIFFLGILLIICIFVRYTIGGVGLSVWLSWSMLIMITSITIRFNSKMFLERLLKVIVFISFISIVGYILQLTVPNVLRSIFIDYNTTFFYREYSTEIDYVSNIYKGYGVLLFSFRDGELSRNLGIFTEPGIYQMVLNAGIFILLFFENININYKKKVKYAIVIMLAIITCQSTTGYINLISILTGFIFVNKKHMKKFKLQIIGILGVVSLLLLIDYLLNLNNSFLYATIFEKLINSHGKLDLSASTGLYRIGTLNIAIKSMIDNPFGIGYDRLAQLIDMEKTGFVSAAIFTTGAALGIITFILMLTWVILPIVTSRFNIIVKIIYVFMYFNTTISQSHEFYPLLIFMPMYIQYKCYNKNFNRKRNFKIRFC